MAVNHHSRMGRALLNQTGADSKLYVDNFTLASELNKEIIPYRTPALAAMAAMTLVGTISNALVLYIYPKYFKRSSTFYFILCLACYDLFVCVFVLPMNIYRDLHFLDYTNTMLCKTDRLLENAAVIGSALILVVVSGDRYMKIYYPFYHLSGKKIKRICVAIGVSTFIINVPPAVMLFGIMRPKTRIAGFRGYRCNIQEDMRNSRGAKVFNYALTALFFLMFMVMCYFYGKVWLYFRQRCKVAIGETIEPAMLERLKKMAHDKLLHIEEHMDDEKDVSSDSLSPRSELTETPTTGATENSGKQKSESSNTSKFNLSLCRSVLASVTEHALTRPYPPPSHPVRKTSSAAHNAYLDLAIPLLKAIRGSQSVPLDTGMSEGGEHKTAHTELGARETKVRSVSDSGKYGRGGERKTAHTELEARETTVRSATDSGKYGRGGEHKTAHTELEARETTVRSATDSGKYGRGGEHKTAHTELEARETQVSSDTDSIPDFVERVRGAGHEAALPIPITPALSRPSTIKPLQTDLAVTTVKNNDITALPPTPEVSEHRDSATLDEDPERRRLSQEVEGKALQASSIAQTDSKDDMTRAAELFGDFSKLRKPNGATDPPADFLGKRTTRFSIAAPQTSPRSLPSDRRFSTPLIAAKRLTSKLLKPISRTTMSLVAVTVIFFLSYICPVLFIPFGNHSRQKTRVELVVGALLFKLSFIQNVVNPFVYAFFQPKFREHISQLFQALFCRCGKSRVGNLFGTTQATENPSRITQYYGNPSRMNQPSDA